MAVPSLRDLVGRSVSVEVPASSANLGAGYDCLGVALDLTNRIELSAVADRNGEVEVVVEGEGSGELAGDADNRFLAGLQAALRATGIDHPADVGWRIAMHNEIPLSRGLGSSAAATVGGLLAGATLAGVALPTAELLRLATQIEGHPDNAAAVLLGGFVASAVTADGVEAIRLDAPGELRAVLFIPERRLSTAAMRAALPASVPLADAIANLGGVAVGMAGLATGRLEFLRRLTVDRLHEPYRAVAYPELPVMVGAAREAGALGACLSGAGSTILAFAGSAASAAALETAFTAAAARCGLAGMARTVALRNEGARLSAPA